jgi:dihydroorotate dehydrogenase electron transfer subunit
MLQLKAKIIQNKKIKGNYFHAIFLVPVIAKAACPGQFVNIKVSEALEPLLRRPLSIHRIRVQRREFREQIEILYEVVGKGTQILSQRKPGEYLDVIGPLGKGFDLHRQTGKQANRQTIIVAGGMGVAPLLFLAEKLKSQATVLIGTKTKNQILCEKEFKDLGCIVKIATDDGSRGFKGKVTELLKYLLRTKNYELRTIYACGPRPMLKEISRISREYNIPAQICLEEHMACGIGACLGCAVKTREGYQRVCKEGPVFYTDEMLF